MTKTFTEEDWTDPEKLDAVGKSKTLAEKAAWDYVKELPGRQPSFSPIHGSTFGSNSRFLNKNVARSQILKCLEQITCNENYA